jgi:hypothetical protein
MTMDPRVKPAGDDRVFQALHCEARELRSNPSFRLLKAWIASWSLSSGARSRDPWARIGEGVVARHSYLFLFTGFRFSMNAAMPSERSSSAKVE